MHTSFTGTARKQRQVNLTGRSVVNPWGGASSSSKASTQTSAPQSSIEKAQTERLYRQHERQRLTAARKLQKTWRGHASRRRTKRLWEEQWAFVEGPRTKDFDSALRGAWAGRSGAPAYESAQVCLEQLRLLLRFADFRQENHWLYLIWTLNTWNTSIQSRTFRAQLERAATERHVASSLIRLGMLSARILQEMYSRYDAGLCALGSPTNAVNQILRSTESLSQLTSRFDESTADAYLYALSSWFQWRFEFHEASESAFALIGRYIASQTGKPNVYKAIVSRLFSSEALLLVSAPLNRFSQLADREALLDVYLDMLQDDGEQNMTPRKLLWRLAFFLRCIEPNSLNGLPRDSSFARKRIRCLATLLGVCAEPLALHDHSAVSSGKSHLVPLVDLEHSEFVEKLIDQLPREANIAKVLSDLGGETTTGHEMPAARVMAKYAVSLLRAFPTKATNIRRWLFLGNLRSRTAAGQHSVPVIDFFWKAAQGTKVFQGIHQSRDNVLSLLTQPFPQHNQLSRPQYSRYDEEIWKDEWQVIIVFFELYSYVLKPMDDDDFFGRQTLSSRQSQAARKGALLLSDIETMCTFLKNMAYTLYWKAADLEDSDAFETAGGLSPYFGQAEGMARRSERPKQHQTLAGMEGVSHTYLKGVVTGLLRMIHERDSRRPFLPRNFWLMIRDVDMSSFIQDVVAEEEKKHEEGEEEDEQKQDEEGRWKEIFEAEDDLHAVPLDQSHLNFGRDSRTAQIRREEFVERKREVARRKRQRESLAPRLEILRNLPFFVPFETRVHIFREFIKQDQLRRRDGYIDPDAWRMHTAMGAAGAPRGLAGLQAATERIAQHRAEVHRDSIFEDAFDIFYPLGDKLKEPIQISFIDRFGNPEAGIDGGGVTKEFLTSITSEAFDPKLDLPMFAENDQHELYPNPTIFETTMEILRRNGVLSGTPEYQQQLGAFLRRYEFLGRIIGKCIYEGILVDINFAGFFLLKWALSGGSTAASNETAYRASINDVKDFDQGLYQGLVSLKNYTGDVENDFGLNFTVTDTMSFEWDEETVTHTITNPLDRNGASIPVTNANRDRYISAITRYRLQTQPYWITSAFLRGLGQIIEPMWLAMFNQKELQTLVGGENTELDIADLRRNTQYNGLYQIGDDGLEHPTILLFWKVLKQMSDEDRRKVLKFVTSTPRAPLLGFSNLTPPFTIHSTTAGEGIERLPSTSTCVNLLKLPNYRDEKTMRDKLLYAANSGAGFDLS